MKDGWIPAAVVVVLGLMAGCSTEPRTQLVLKMERAGAGDVRVASPQAIEQWFGEHEDVAVEIDRACAPLRAKAPATWRDTTDGRICAAAAKMHAFHYRPRPIDGKTFQAGKK